MTVSVLCPGPTATEFGNRAGIEMIPFFEGPLVMTADRLAREGYEGMWAGKGLLSTAGSTKLEHFPIESVPADYLNGLLAN
ncbi:MAG: hypothetical protein P8O70_12670 [SAR324 cluster bacterium]|nr:hypothetical protein [SAR324 cluster bacterium]